MTIKSDSAVGPAVLPTALPWALIGAACLGSFAATSSGTTRAPFLLDMAEVLLALELEGRLERHRGNRVSLM